MASKGKKFNKYSEELKKQVMEEHRQGNGDPKYLGRKSI